MHCIPLFCTSSPCNLLFSNLGVYGRVQATVGVGTVLIWDFCVAYTRGGGYLFRYPLDRHSVPKSCHLPTACQPPVFCVTHAACAPQKSSPASYCRCLCILTSATPPAGCRPKWPYFCGRCDADCPALCAGVDASERGRKSHVAVLLRLLFEGTFAHWGRRGQSFNGHRPTFNRLRARVCVGFTDLA